MEIREEKINLEDGLLLQIFHAHVNFTYRLHGRFWRNKIFSWFAISTDDSQELRGTQLFVYTMGMVAVLFFCVLQRLDLIPLHILI